MYLHKIHLNHVFHDNYLYIANIEIYIYIIEVFYDRFHKYSYVVHAYLLFGVRL